MPNFQPLAILKIPHGSPAVGVAIKDLALPPNAVIAAIIREGQILVPRGGVTFEVGDEVLAIANPSETENLAALFCQPRNQSYGLQRKNPVFPSQT